MQTAKCSATVPACRTDRSYLLARKARSHRPRAKAGAGRDPRERSLSACVIAADQTVCGQGLRWTLRAAGEFHRNGISGLFDRGHLDTQTGNNGLMACESPTEHSLKIGLVNVIVVVPALRAHTIITTP